MGLSNAMLLGRLPASLQSAMWQQQGLAQQATMAGLARNREATNKAVALLRTRLGEQEWRLFERTQTLTVPSRLWLGTFYLLRPNDAVKVVRDGRVTASLCVLLTGGEPWPDRLMTILDLIQSDERRLWQMANLMPTTPPPGLRRLFLHDWLCEHPVVFLSALYGPAAMIVGIWLWLF